MAKAPSRSRPVMQIVLFLEIPRNSFLSTTRVNLCPSLGGYGAIRRGLFVARINLTKLDEFGYREFSGLEFGWKNDFGGCQIRQSARALLKR